MSNLMGLLDLGASAIHAQNAGIATASNNAANVNTEDYSRQRVDLRANPGSPVYGGVTFGDPDRIGSSLLASRQRLVGGVSGYFDSLSNSLLDLEAALTAADVDISAGLSEFFGTINNLATSPLDHQQRAAVVDAAQQVAAAFRRQSNNLSNSRNDADQRVRDAAASATELSTQIAKLNKAILLRSDPVLLDQRETAARKLSELVGGKARIDDDGQMRFLLDNGSVVVDGNRPSSFETTTDAALDNMSRIDLVDDIHRRDITSEVSSGTLAADIHFRDVVAVRVGADADQLAFDVSTQINSVHRTFAGLDGVSGRDFFVEPSTLAGAAAQFAVDPTVAADPARLASAAAGQPAGDNSGLLALLDTREQPLANNGTRTFIDESIRYVSEVGQDARTAVAEQKFHQTQKRNLDDLRDSISGVSLEEELNRLSQFQHASQANMQFVNSIDQLLGNMIDLL